MLKKLYVFRTHQHSHLYVNAQLTTLSPTEIVSFIKGSNGTTINIFVVNTYHNLNTYTEKHFLRHKYLRMDKGQ